MFVFQHLGLLEKNQGMYVSTLSIIEVQVERWSTQNFLVVSRVHDTFEFISM